MAAAVVIGSLKMPSHFENGRLLEIRTLPGSQRSANRVEQHLHLFTALRDITEIIDDQALECSQALDESTEFQIAFCDQQVLHKPGRSGEVDAVCSRDQLLVDGAEQVRFPFPGLPKAKTFSQRSRNSPSGSVFVISAASRFRLKFDNAFSAGIRD